MHYFFVGALLGVFSAGALGIISIKVSSAGETRQEPEGLLYWYYRENDIPLIDRQFFQKIKNLLWDSSLAIGLSVDQR